MPFPCVSASALVGLLFLAPVPSIQAAVPAVRIAPFAGDRAAAVSYTFDDGIRDQYTLAVPMLNEVGFKGTFFVIPGAVVKTVPEAEIKKDAKRAWGSITWDELREIAKQGHEIGSHTWDHRGLRKLSPAEVDVEFSKSSDAIKAEIGQPPLTLAFPFNQSSPEIDAAALKYYIAYRAYQLGVGGKSTVAQLNKWADQQIHDRKWGVVMAHAIGHGYAAFENPDILREHFKYVKSREKDVWVDTFANVARYQKERDDARVSVATVGAGHATLSLSGSLDPSIYNVPLTVVLDVPGATFARAERDGRELLTRITKSTIQIDAAPAPGPITVIWK